MVKGNLATPGTGFELDKSPATLPMHAAGVLPAHAGRERKGCAYTNLSTNTSTAPELAT